MPIERHRDGTSPPALAAGSDAAPCAGAIDARTRRYLGRRLRRFYAHVLEQPLPDRFVRLLDDMAACPGRGEDLR